MTIPTRSQFNRLLKENRELKVENEALKLEVETLKEKVYFLEETTTPFKSDDLYAERFV